MTRESNLTRPQPPSRLERNFIEKQLQLDSKTVCFQTIVTVPVWATANYDRANPTNQSFDGYVLRSLDKRFARLEDEAAAFIPDRNCSTRVRLKGRYNMIGETEFCCWVTFRLANQIDPAFMVAISAAAYHAVRTLFGELNRKHGVPFAIVARSRTTSLWWNTEEWSKGEGRWKTLFKVAAGQRNKNT